MFSGKELEKILPHKFPMIVLDRVVEYDLDNRRLTAEVKIKHDSIFFDATQNQVPIALGIEYMAQTIGALSGIYNLDNRGAEPILGFVIGTRNYEVFTNGFNLGDVLSISVEQLFFDSQMGSFSCEIFCGRDKLAQAYLNIFQPRSIEEFFKNHE